MIQPKYTLCSLTRYLDDKNHGRILTAEGGQCNFLHGHWAGRAGVVLNSGWYAGTSNLLEPKFTNWLAMCAKSNGNHPNNILVNEEAVGTATNRCGSEFPLATNPRETSNFEIAEIIVWDSELKDQEMADVETYLMSRILQADCWRRHTCGEGLIADYSKAAALCPDDVCSDELCCMMACDAIKDEAACSERGLQLVFWRMLQLFRDATFNLARG
jgi:hypothetical protein